MESPDRRGRPVRGGTGLLERDATLHAIDALLAACGQSNREISQTLFVTPKTVEYHLRNAHRKLDISGRQELASAHES